MGVGKSGLRYAVTPIYNLPHDLSGSNRNGEPYYAKAVTIGRSREGITIYDRNGKEIRVPVVGRDTSGKEILVFVMLNNGEILVNHLDDHQMLSGGQAVAAAGLFYRRSSADGKVYFVVSDSSGHYMPSLSFTKQVLLELQRRGVDLKDVKVELHGKEDAVDATSLIDRP